MPISTGQVDLDRNEPRSEVINSIFSNAFIALKYVYILDKYKHQDYLYLTLNGTNNYVKIYQCKYAFKVDVTASKFTNANNAFELERLHQYQDE